MTPTLQIDDVSLLVRTSATASVRQLEQALNDEGYTLGFLNPHLHPTVGELLEKNPFNLLHRLYGQPVDFCVSVTVRGKEGQRYQTKRVPRSATGPDFRALLLAAVKQFGSIEEAVLRIHPLPEKIDWHVSYWPTELDGEEFVRELVLLSIHPSYIGIMPVARQPKKLRREGKSLVALRWAGPEGIVGCYEQRAAALAKQMKGEVVTATKQKHVPLLEKIMQEERT